MESAREFLSQAGNLKTLKRWWHPSRTLEGAESVAAHTFRAALLTLLLPTESTIDRDRVMRMLLVHDLPESDSEVGDITPYDGIPQGEKKRREEKAMHKLCGLLPNGSEVLNLWQEYQTHETEEARIAHDLDKLERSLQIQEYAAKGQISPEECAHVIQDDYAKIQTATIRQMFEVLILHGEQPEQTL